MTDTITDRVEYSVVPITRYQVLRYYEDHTAEGGKGGGSSQRGIFDREDTAFEVAYALAEQDRVALGWDVGDERLQFPKDDPRYNQAVPA